MQGVFFLHLPKCAGTTIWYALHQLYGRNRVFRVGTPQDRLRLEEMSSRERRGFAALGGHGPLAHFRQWIDDLDQRCRITIVREPAERTISEYEFIRRQTMHPKHGLVSRLSLLEFASQPQVVNLQTRMICGRPDAAASIETLDSQFDEVGAPQDVDAIMDAVCRRSGGRRIKTLPRKNEGGARQPVALETLEALAELNAEDVALYEAILRRSGNARSVGTAAAR